MIKSEKGEVTISGSFATASIELVHIIHSFRKMCIDTGIESEAVDDLIVTIGKAAYEIGDEDSESIEVILD